MRHLMEKISKEPIEKRRAKIIMGRMYSSDSQKAKQASTSQWHRRRIINLTSVALPLWAARKICEPIFFCFSLVKLVKCIMTADIIFCFFFRLLTGHGHGHQPSREHWKGNEYLFINLNSLFFFVFNWFFFRAVFVFNLVNLSRRAERSQKIWWGHDGTRRRRKHRKDNSKHLICSRRGIWIILPVLWV